MGWRRRGMEVDQSLERNPLHGKGWTPWEVSLSSYKAVQQLNKRNLRAMQLHLYLLLFKSVTAKRGCTSITLSFPLIVLVCMLKTPTRKQWFTNSNRIQHFIGQRGQLWKGRFSLWHFPNFKQNFVRHGNTFVENWNFLQKTLPGSAIRWSSL